MVYGLWFMENQNWKSKLKKYDEMMLDSVNNGH